MIDRNDSALLLLNLGSPDSYSVSDVRKYLGEFLMDERVIDAPYLVRSMIVKGFILPFRPKKSAHAYQKVWTKEGSPLKVITESFKKELEELVDMPVAVAMRYGNPTPAAALEELKIKTGLKMLYVAPMYPHYAMSSYETAVEHVLRYIDKSIPVKILKPFYNEETYINSLTESIRPFVNSSPPHLLTSSPRPLATSSPHVLFSYHGLPVRHLRKASTHCYSSPDCCTIPSKGWDTCYKHQVTQTTKLVAEKLRLREDQYSLSFQSRLGRDEWIKPFTVELLQSYPAKGIKNLVVVCPAFVADCLETLEEIAMAGREIFMNAGGESFTVVPCLNTSKPWVNTFASWCNDREKQHSVLWK
ncbi:MAG TPA: ferrochelatase [Cyclobacteriaceae bacterium]